MSAADSPVRGGRAETAGVFGAPAPSEDADSVDLMTPALLLWDYRRLIVAVAAAVVVLAVLVALSLETRYTAITQLSLGSRQQNYVDVERVVTGPAMDEEVVAGEIGTILSNATLRRVIVGLRLDRDPDFSPVPTVEDPSFLSRISGWLGGGPDADAEGEAAPPDVLLDERVMDQTVRALRRSLTVTPLGNSLVVNVSAESNAPRKAALIANAVSNSYILGQFELLRAEGDRASAWFGERLTELRTRISEAEDQLERSRISQLEIFGQSEAALLARLEEISRRLAMAQSDRVAQQARVDRIEAAEGDRTALAALPEVLLSELADALRGQISELTGEKARLMTRYGRNHPEVLSLEAEIGDLQAALDAEVDRIVAAGRNELARARATEAGLREDVQDLELTRVRQQQATVELRALEAEVETNRQIYLDFLTRFREVSETATLVQPDATIISDARPPQFGSGPPRRLIVAIAGFLGFGLGCLLAFLIEALNQTVRTGDQAERVLGIPHLGSLPRVASLRWQRHPLSRDGLQPHMFAESLRSVAVRVRHMVSEGRTSIGITSADPAAGKSIVSATLAEVLAEDQLRLLLIECDIHRPYLGNVVLDDDAAGAPRVLSEMLTRRDRITQADIADAIDACLQKTGYGFDFLRIGGIDTEARNFLGSPALPEAFDQIAKRYDLVLVNLPPILPVSDTIRVMRYLDSVLMIVRWNRTPRTSLRSAMKKAGAMREKFLGVILSDVDPRRAAPEEIAILSTEKY